MDYPLCNSFKGEQSLFFFMSGRNTVREDDEETSR